jgi:mannose-6-phosphate isomerase
MLNLYPLRLEPYVKEVVWGGRWLADELHRPGKPDAPLGESWEAYSESLITNGTHAGHKLGELFSQYGAEFAGERAMSYPKFPLLVKFIDARQNLSVQIHPNDEQAQTLENYPFGKTEFWYIMKAEPDAAIHYSLNDSATSPEVLREAIANGTLTEYTQVSPVREGDVVFIPAGTVHALTKGIVVYELQQDSDITYRLYDWGRTDRQIHIDKGLEVVNFTYKKLPITHPAPVMANGYSRTPLVECQYFASEVWEVPATANFEAASGSFTLLSGLEGTGQVVATDGAAFEPQTIGKGDTLLLPAGLNFALSATSGAPLKVIAGWLA